MTDTTTCIPPLQTPSARVREALEDLLDYIWDELYDDFYQRPESEHHHISACILKGWLAEMAEADASTTAPDDHGG